MADKKRRIAFLEGRIRSANRRLRIKEEAGLKPNQPSIRGPDTIRSLQKTVLDAAAELRKLGVKRGVRRR